MSIFLAAFNFARNTQENIRTRDLVKTSNSPEEGRKHFINTLERIQANLVESLKLLKTAADKAIV